MFTVDALDDAALAEALAYCLTPAARAKAQDCSNRAVGEVRRSGKRSSQP